MVKISRLTNIVSFVGGVIAVAILTVMVFIAVVMRYLFNAPLFYADEIATYLIMAIGFLGFAYTMKSGGHIRVEVLYNLFPTNVQRFVQIVAYVLLFIFTVILLASSILLVLDYYKMGTSAETVLMTPLFLPALLMVIGSVLLLVNLIAEIHPGKE